MESSLFQSYVSAKKKIDADGFPGAKCSAKCLGYVGMAFLCFLDGEDSWLLFRSFSGQNIQQDETKFETAPSFPRGRSNDSNLQTMNLREKNKSKTVPSKPP